MHVTSLGDLLLDVVVRLEQPRARGADATSRITLSAGGQGANVAAWVAELGGRARWLGKRGVDDAGELVSRALLRRGVELAGPVDDGATGVLVSLVEPGGERSMLPDRGVALTFGPEELEASWLRTDHLHVSGYALFVEPLRAVALRAVELARGFEAGVSVDLSSWSGIRDAGAANVAEAVRRIEPDVVFANEAELEVIGGAWEGPAWIVKRGAAGCTFAGEERAARPATVVDTTGAGDALAAGWILGGAELALDAAARCVEHVGAMPPL